MATWKKIILLFLMCGVAILSYACASSDYRMVTEQGEQKIEKTKTYNKDFVTVWSAVLKTITLKGYAVVNQDKDTGIISTEFLETRGASLYKFGYRHKLNILVEKQSNSTTQVTIKPTFQIKLNYKAQWKLGRRRPHQVDIEKNIFAEIKKHL